MKNITAGWLSLSQITVFANSVPDPNSVTYCGCLRNYQAMGLSHRELFPRNDPAVPYRWKNLQVNIIPQ